MSRKKQLLSIILSFCIVVASLGGIMVSAAEVSISNLTVVTQNVLYKYYQDPAANTKIFKSGDTFTSNDIFDVYVEGEHQGSYGFYGSYELTDPASDYIVSEYAYIAHTCSGRLSLVSATAEPTVYIATSATGDYVPLDVGTADKTTGMASATIPESCPEGVDPAVYETAKSFYDGLNITVTKTVEKLTTGSLKLQIKGKDGTDYTDDFCYYRDATQSSSKTWAGYINSSTTALGGILSADVKIYIGLKDPLLRVQASAGTGGSISPTDNYYVASDTGSKIYTITPPEGYEIDKVEQRNQGETEFTDITSKINLSGQYTLTPGDTTWPAYLNQAEIKVSFKSKTYGITVIQGEHGTIAPSENVSVEHGNNQTFTITPNDGYEIKDVLVDGKSVLNDVLVSGGVGTYTLTNVTAAHTITAEFVKLHQIDLSVGENGGAYFAFESGGERVYSQITRYPGNIRDGEDSQILYIKPDENYVPVVTDNGVEKTLGSPNDDGYYGYQITGISEDHTVNVTFTYVTYGITVIQGEHGTIAPSENVSVEHGNNQTFTITPNDGYEIKDVLVDGKSVLNDVSVSGGVGTYTLTNVTAAHTITAEFVKLHQIDLSVGENGGVYFAFESGGERVYSQITQYSDNIRDGEDSQILYIKPDENYVPVVTDNGVEKTLGSPNSDEYYEYQIKGISEDHTVNVTFTHVTYGITVIQGEHGTIAPSENVSVEHGNNQTFTITPNDGYKITNVQVDGASVFNDVVMNDGTGTYTFENVTANHTLEAVIVPTYPPVVNQPTWGGTVDVSPDAPAEGDSVTITATPSEGYKVGNVTVTYEDGNSIEIMGSGNGPFTFTQPGSKVTVTVSFTKLRPAPGSGPAPESDSDCDGGNGCPSRAFTDLNPAQWYHQAVDYAIIHGLMNGMSDTVFAPDGIISRAMLVTILYRLEGEPAAGTCKFIDVSAGQWYTDAVAWAAEHEIVKGYGDGRFGPSDSLTREQLATIMYRYAAYKGYDVSARADLSAFTDCNDTDSWAKEAMSWAVAEKLFIGIGVNKLAPHETANRAQMATILYRFCENIAK